MIKYSQYTFKQILSASTLFTSSSLLILIVIYSLKFLEKVLKSKESFALLFKFMALAIPDLFVVVLPIAIFISTMYVYSRMDIDRELIAMYSIGINRWKIAKPAVLFALLSSIVILCFTLFILPASFKALKEEEFKLRKSLPSVLVQPGAFTSFSGTTIYVRERDKSKILRGIFIQSKSVNVPYNIMAQEGFIFFNEDLPFMILRNGVKQELRGGRLSSLTFEKMTIPLEMNTSKEELRATKPHELSSYEILFDPPENYTFHHFKMRSYTELLQRIISAFLPSVLVMIGLLFLLLSPFKRQGDLVPILISIGASISFLLVYLMLVRLGTHHYLLAMLTIPLMGSIFGGGVYLLKKDRVVFNKMKST